MNGKTITNDDLTAFMKAMQKENKNLAEISKHGDKIGQGGNEERSGRIEQEDRRNKRRQ